MIRHYLYYLCLFIAFVFIQCTHRAYISSGEVSTTEINSDEIPYTAPSEIENIIEPYRSTLDLKMNTIIGTTADELEKSGDNGSLGYFMVDAVTHSVEKKLNKQYDLCILNQGGIRLPFIAKGDITLSTIYQLMPFENEIVILSIHGAILKQLCDRIAQSGGWPISHSLHLINSRDKAEKISINNEPLDVNKTYTLITNSYIAEGGSDCSFLINVPKVHTGYLVRDAIIDYMRFQTAQDSTIKAISEKRIKRRY